MPISKEKKSEILKDLEEKIDQQKSIVFVETKGLKTKDIETLKKELRKENCSFLIAKKTLLNIVLKNKKIDPLDIETQFGIVLGFEDEIAPARIVYKKSKTDNIKILGGIFENEIKPEQEIIALAQLPSRNVLLQRLTGSICYPLTGFLNILQANIKGLIYALNSIKK
ncbi:MAG: 50S ribosomal protein L10 [Candidatus Pacebacteria bacterium]|nr:50S ribosomal protein L10 [Candidatus Paceibacterota bacterium]